MKIAFVGKGGSGKSTLSALFSLYVGALQKSLLVIDADINMHIPELMGVHVEDFSEKFLSEEKNVRDIKEYLKGENTRILSPAHFKKSTPPALGSRWIDLEKKDQDFFKKYAILKDTIDLMVVGSYEKGGIGTSCYHNNLSIVENVLSHTKDNAGVVVVDMVAGIDAFAGTLHSQFDMIVLVVEPTRRSIEVFYQYIELGRAAGIDDRIFVLGNKVRFSADYEYMTAQIPSAYLLGIFEFSSYIYKHDQQGGAFSIDALEEPHRRQLGRIFDHLSSKQRSLAQRLPKLWELHRKYCAQEYIRARVGDLKNQIDPSLIEQTQAG